MLNTKKLLAKIVKSLGIITSGNWSYLKIGKLFIGAYSTSGSLTIATQVGSVYQTAATATITIAETLTANLFSHVSVITSAYSVWTAIYEASSTTIGYRALSAASRPSRNYEIKAIVIGIV